MPRDGIQSLGVLPTASVAIMGIYTIPICYAVGLLTAVDQSSLEVRSAYTWALGGIIASAAMAFCSHVLPRSIRTRTTVIAFFLWLLLAVAFFVATGFYSRQLPFGMSIEAALVILLFLAYYFHLRHLLTKESAEPGAASSDVDPEIALLMRKVAALVFGVACSIAAVVVPILAFCGDSYLQTIPKITLLHVAAFLGWLLVAVFGALEHMEAIL